MTNASAWDVARSAGRRVFYERATETIRTCPANYCLVVRDGETWAPFVDAASPITEPAITRLLGQGWREEQDGEVLADAIEEAFYGSQPLSLA